MELPNLLKLLEYPSDLIEVLIPVLKDYIGFFPDGTLELAFVKGKDLVLEWWDVYKEDGIAHFIITLIDNQLLLLQTGNRKGEILSSAAFYLDSGRVYESELIPLPILMLTFNLGIAVSEYLQKVGEQANEADSGSSVGFSHQTGITNLAQTRPQE